MSPLSEITPSYLYAQYADDENLQAFVNAYNDLAQSYLDWFNETPLPIYTNTNISGAFLDWIGENIYQVARPAISNITTLYRAALITVPMIQRALSTSVYSQSGTSYQVSDDIYKRILTWYTYRGDGMQATLPWLRRRIARFLYGVNGADIDPSDYLSSEVNVTYTGTVSPVFIGAVGSSPINTVGINNIENVGLLNDRGITIINLPETAAGTTLYNLLSQGVLPLPFQLNFRFENTIPAPRK